jgi:hypothetical protein
MANEWFVQHGGKQYGPLSAANLKKLATEGKITATTSVRKGEDGAWVPASRVQGLFATQAAPVQSSTAPPSQVKATAPPQTTKVVSPPVAPPLAPPLATPVARPALGSFGSLPNAAPVENASMPARIVGAVALILGTLALATFWLPSLGAMGWTGIAVGGLGLLLGIGGLVLSALHKGSGLNLNIAGTASSAVGLVLTVVFGVVFGMFSSTAPTKPLAIVLPPRPVQPAPTLPPSEPEPEPEPELVWTEAGESIQQGAIKATIASAKIEQVTLESADLSTLKKQKPKPMLRILVTIENTTTDKIVDIPGWPGGGDLIPQELSQSLKGSELGKALQSTAASATLTDNVGNPYKQESAGSVFGLQLSTDNSLRPAKSVEKMLLFPPPLESIEYLHLELAPGGFGGSEPLRFRIRKAFIAQPAK